MEDISTRLATDAERGLSATEAAGRLARTGANVLPSEGRTGTLRLLVRQFTGFIIYVLAAATLVSVVAGEWIDASAIVAIVLLNGVLGFVQEYRAERSLAALERLTAPSARVIRDAGLVSVAASDIVPGDLIAIEAGDIIPADARLISGRHLRCQEASLTGESASVDKQAGVVLDPDTVLGDRVNMVFASTVATYGSARALVVATGPWTEAGLLAAMARGRRDITPLQRRLEEAVRLLVLAAVGLAVVLFAAATARGADVSDTLLTVVALAVAAIPEGLPAAVTVVLALGVQRMVRRHVIVRRLASVETLGSTTVICTDKTGTLTQNRMEVREIFSDGARRPADQALFTAPVSFSADRAWPADPVRWSALIAALCNTAIATGRSGEVIGDPTEAALLRFAGSAGVELDLRSRWRLVDELPFDSERQRMTSVLEAERGRLITVMKGAPEAILPKTTALSLRGAEVPLHAAGRRRIENVAAEMAADGLRVLAMAYRLDDEPQRGAFEEHMVFVSLVGLVDPLRPEAKDAVETCRRAGIRPMMLTGDHPETARAIARDLGFTDGPVVTGRQLSTMSDEQLKQTVEMRDVYARVSGEHKMRIVRALHAGHQIVAMTGDGVNDAPALHGADIGVAMGRSGTDVARQASDMVLTDDDFSSIVAAVEEGRTIYANIRRLVLFLLSCNLGEVAFISIASIVTAEPALLPVQILWVNLVTDSLPALALGAEPGRADQMQRPPRDPSTPMVSPRVIPSLALQGALIASSALIAFAVGMRSGDVEDARELAFMTLVMAHLLAALNFRSLRRPLIAIGPLTNGALIAAIVLAAGLQLMPFYVLPLNDAFDVSPLSAGAWALVLSLALIAFVPVELAKFLRFGAGEGDFPGTPAATDEGG